MKISVVVAAYDEAETIVSLTRRLTSTLVSTGCRWEIVFVVEGRDGTREIIEGLAEQTPEIRLLYREDPRGLGEAFRRAFAAVSPDVDLVVTLDADLNHQPEEIPRLLSALESTGADLVVGSRFVEGSRVEGVPLWKRLLSGAANRLMGRLYGLCVRDKTSGFRVYRAAVLRNIRYSSDTFSFLPELLIRIAASGYSIVEEPIHFTFRRQGESKLRFWNTSWAYLRLFAARFERSRRGTPALVRSAIVVAPLLVGLVIYFPTLGLSFAYDDIDYLNQAATVLAGRGGFWEIAWRPQGEHILPVFRTIWLGNAALFGINAVPYRLLVLFAHAATGSLLGLLALRYSGCGVAAVAAAVAYVLPAGFSSMWLWFPSGSAVPFFLLAFSASLVFLASSDQLGWRRSRAMAGLMAVIALACESTLAPLVSSLVLLDLWERKRRGARPLVGAFALGVAALALATVGVAALLVSGEQGPGISISLRHGLPRALFLLLVAPFRLLLPGASLAWWDDQGLTTAVYGSLLGLASALPLMSAALFLWRRSLPRLAKAALVVAPGPLGVVLLVGLGRWKTSYWALYYNDRYFFTLMVPLCLLFGALAATLVSKVAAWPVRRRRALWALACLLTLAELVLHRQAMLEIVYFEAYRSHTRRFEQLQRLNEQLEEAALALPEDSPPLLLPDSEIWIHDIHNGRLSTRFLLFVLGHGAGDRLALGPPRVGARDAALLSPLLSAWSAELSSPVPRLAIVDGQLCNLHLDAAVDLRDPTTRDSIVEGFYSQESDGRWMTDTGVLRMTSVGGSLLLSLHAPVSWLKTVVGPEALELHVALRDTATGDRVELGSLSIDHDGPVTYAVSTAAFVSRFGDGRLVDLLLHADRTWTPANVPGSSDRRERSIKLIEARFAAAATMLPCGGGARE